MSSVDGIGGSGFSDPINEEIYKRILSSDARGPSISDYWQFMQAMSGIALQNLFAIRRFDATYHLGEIDNIKARADYWKALLDQLEGHKQLFYQNQAVEYDNNYTTPINDSVADYNTLISNDYDNLKNYLKTGSNLADINAAIAPPDNQLPAPPNVGSLNAIYPIETEAEYDEEERLAQLANNRGIVNDNNQTLQPLITWLTTYNSLVGAINANYPKTPPFEQLSTPSPLPLPPTTLPKYDPSTFPVKELTERLENPTGQTLSTNLEKDVNRNSTFQNDAISEILRKLLKRSPGQEADVKLTETVPSGSGVLAQVAQLPTADMSAVFLDIQTQIVARSITRRIVNEAPSAQKIPSAGEVANLIKSSLIVVLDYLNIPANLDALALASNVLGQNLSLDDPALKFFTALAHLEQAIGFLGSDALPALFADREEFQQLPEALRNAIISLLTSAVALPLLSIAFTQLGIVLGDSKALDQLLVNLYDARRKAPNEPIDALAKGLETPLADQLQAVIAKGFEGRLNTKQQEALAQRILTELFGPTLLTLGPKKETEAVDTEAEIVEREVESPSARKGAEIQARDQEIATVLPSAVDLFFKILTVVLEEIKETEKNFVEEVEEKFREAPTIRLTEDLAEWFVRKLLPSFQFEHTPGAPMYHFHKDANIDPPDVLFPA